MTKPKSRRPWYTNAVVYQIYPRSFQDSNGDGVGDLNGIRQRLGYLDSLGVDAIWLSPFYKSPMKDFGYDISDYCDVDPIFGTLKDFDRLLKEAHKLDIKVLADLVPNHTSDQHPWFLESRQSRDNPKSDWYIWRDAKPDGSPPNNWISVFSGSVWEWCDERQQYYLHSFMKEQPDLNWENPEVRQAMAEVMRFWLKRGVDGFRVDAIDLMGKDLSFADEQTNPYHKGDKNLYDAVTHNLSRDAGNFFDYLRFMADVVGEYDDKLVIWESYIIERHKPELYWHFYQQIDLPNCLPFNFELLFMDWSASEIQRFVDPFQAGLRATDIPVYVLGNHDQQRFATKVGREEARAGAMLLMTLPGISLVYNGEEIGMHDVEVPDHQRNDADNRDKCRTPMQWSDENYAGFSNQEPWLPLADDYRQINVDRQEADPDSMLNLYKNLIAMHHANPALNSGGYEPGPKIKNVVSFTRATDKQSLLVLVNISASKINSKLKGYKLLMSSIADRQEFDGKLNPHEGVVLTKFT